MADFTVVQIPPAPDGDECAQGATNAECGVPPKPAQVALRTNFAWTLIGNITYSGCQWAMLSVIAKSTNPESVGMFTLALAITAPVLMLTNLNLRAVQATDALHTASFAHYFGLRLVTTAAALLFIMGLCFSLHYERQTLLVIAAIAMAKAFESVSDVFQGMLQQYERFDVISKSLIIKGTASLAGLSLAMYWTRSIMFASATLAAIWLLGLISYDVPMSRRVIAEFADRPGKSRMLPNFAASALGPLAARSFPLGFAMMLISLNVNLPRYFVNTAAGSHGLGIFAALASVQLAGAMVVNALGQSATPRLSVYFARGQARSFLRLTLRILGLGVLVGIAGILTAALAGRPILRLLYRQEYADQASLLVWVMAAAAVSYLSSFIGYAITAARYFAVQLPWIAASTGVTAIACWVLVPKYSLQGAAMALLAGSVAQLVSGLCILTVVVRSAWLSHGTLQPAVSAR